ncbi:hypothetical protein TREMEDRAFT_61053 [Tremella mesenterica DSM 1558]|uniref:uncharacterized protein n=1 Tax=Tremella mesenterica (strain ATCC 24925 / CBS 8224 / DSM 1558 / NBRC 9311 / NRRL Y-6157 / RJB 2259-6 / UBC 559-6) TaxID=578456 RepID=UPI0003F49C20|nr:uncharacterized protein TREMEDRAFT_61053 [Tremella mesenterica DSM 1558]EIW70545.1 hypothetical protein TREMEDRAFT_61053 [Tremella mesenterica DSM 1558]
MSDPSTSPTLCYHRNLSIFDLIKKPLGMDGDIKWWIDKTMSPPRLLASRLEPSTQRRPSMKAIVHLILDASVVFLERSDSVISWVDRNLPPAPLSSMMSRYHAALSTLKTTDQQLKSLMEKSTSGVPSSEEEDRQSIDYRDVPMNVLLKVVEDCEIPGQTLVELVKMMGRTSLRYL